MMRNIANVILQWCTHLKNDLIFHLKWNYFKNFIQVSWFMNFCKLLMLTAIALWKVVVVPWAKGGNAYQHVFNFHRGRTIVCCDWGLPYHSIATRVDQDHMTVYKYGIDGFRKVTTKSCAGSQWSTITNC